MVTNEVIKLGHKRVRRF